MRFLYMLMDDDDAGVPDFTTEFFAASPTEVPSRILKKSAAVLREKSLTHEHGQWVLYVFTALVFNARMLFAKEVVRDKHGLIPTMIIGWHRQICHDSKRALVQFYIIFEIMW